MVVAATVAVIVVAIAAKVDVAVVATNFCHEYIWKYIPTNQFW